MSIIIASVDLTGGSDEPISYSLVLPHGLIKEPYIRLSFGRVTVYLNEAQRDELRELLKGDGK